MAVLRLAGTAHDEFWGRRSPDRGVLAGLPEPGSVLLADIPTRLVLVPVVSPREHGAALIPDYLLRIPFPPANIKLVGEAGRGVARKPRVERKGRVRAEDDRRQAANLDRKSTRLNSSHLGIS